jgi:hypothetical protein
MACLPKHWCPVSPSTSASWRPLSKAV